MHSLLCPLAVSEKMGKSCCSAWGGWFGKVLMFFNCSLLHQLLIVLKSSGLIKPGGLSKNVCLIVILMIVKKLGN